MTNIEIGCANTLDISEVAYELYKQDWVDTHTSPEMRLNALRAYYLYREECIINDFEIDSFEEWIWESGYESGILYVCYDEFLDYEYQDEDYMENLLHDEDLIKLYHEDIDNNVE